MKMRRLINILNESDLKWEPLYRAMMKWATDSLISDKETIEYVKYMGRVSDQFWNGDYDSQIINAKNLDDLYDGIWGAVSEYQQEIRSYLMDKWNHPPGYKVPKNIKFKEMTQKDADQFIIATNPDFIAYLKEKERLAELKWKERQARKRKEKIALIKALSNDEVARMILRIMPGLESAYKKDFQKLKEALLAKNFKLLRKYILNWIEVSDFEDLKAPRGNNPNGWWKREVV